MNFLVILSPIPIITYKLYDSKFIYILIYSYSAALLLQTTLQGYGLVGMDLHLEYFFYNEYLSKGVSSVSHAYNSSSLLNFILPWATKILGIPGYTLFRICIPLLFATVPVFLFSIYSKITTKQIALLGTFIFFLFSSYLIEISGMAKMMAAETCLIVSLWLLMSNIRLLIKIPSILVLVFLASTIHYTVGIIALGFITFSLILNIRQKEAKILLLGLVGLIGLLGLYFYLVSNGIILDLISSTFNAMLHPIPSGLKDNLSISSRLVIDIDSTYRYLLDIPVIGPNLYYLPDPVKAALCLDIRSVPPVILVFRLLQFLIQIGLLVGSIMYLKTHLRGSFYYRGLVFFSFVLAIASVLTSSLAFALNATRLFHIILISTSPLIILGLLKILRNKIYLLLPILLVYFSYTTGIVYEISKYESSKLGIPYSIALSNYRNELQGTYSESDIKVAKFIWSSMPLPLYSDLHGFNLLEEGIFDRQNLNNLPADLKGLKPPYYIFLRERNDRDQSLTYWNGSGLRKSISYKESGLDLIIESSQILYQVGNSKLLYIKEK
jgi:uncharacterized membrane protein